MTVIRSNRNPKTLNPYFANSSSHPFFADFDQLVNQFVKPVSPQIGRSDYPIDLYETEDNLVLEMVVAGFKAEDLDISVAERKLTVKANLEKATQDAEAQPDAEPQEQEAAQVKPETRRYWMQSIAKRDFSRSLKLPQNVDVDAISANVENGMLTLTMPKVAEAKVKRIEITHN